MQASICSYGILHRYATLLYLRGPAFMQRPALMHRSYSMYTGCAFMQRSRDARPRYPSNPSARPQRPRSARARAPPRRRDVTASRWPAGAIRARARARGRPCRRARARGWSAGAAAGACARAFSCPRARAGGARVRIAQRGRGIGRAGTHRHGRHGARRRVRVRLTAPRTHGRGGRCARTVTGSEGWPQAVGLRLGVA